MVDGRAWIPGEPLRDPLSLGQTGRVWMEQGLGQGLSEPLSCCMCCDIAKGWEASLRRILLPGSLGIGVRKEVRLGMWAWNS